MERFTGFPSESDLTKVSTEILSQELKMRHVSDTGEHIIKTLDDVDALAPLLKLLIFGI